MTITPRTALLASAPAFVAATTLALPATAQVVNADECAGATAIAGTGVFAFDTRSATPTSDPDWFAGSITMNYDVWARWVAPQTGWVALDTCVNGTSSAQVSVYLGGDCATLLPLAVGELNFPCFSDVARFWTTQGQTYTLRLDLPRRQGSFSLAYSTPFPGDDCHNAIEVSGTGLKPFNNTGATSAYLPADPYVYFTNDVWYRWTAPASGPTYIHTCGLIEYPGMGIQVFPDLCPAPAAEIAGNTNAPGCGGARVDFVAQAGTTYRIRIGTVSDSYRTAAGQFEIAQVTGGGGGETIVVTTTEDVTDFTGAQNFSSLPGPDGRVSFREACIAANNTAGGQRIEFAIPQSEWYYPITTFNYAAIRNSSGNPFLLTDDQTVIDGATQTASIGDTNPNGPDVGFWGGNPNALLAPNIILSGSDCTISNMGGAGFIGYSLWIEGDNNRLQGCVLTQSMQGDLVVRGDNNLIGGTEPGQGNTIEGAAVDGGNNNVFVGNRLIGIGVGGAANTRIGGPTLAERNIIGGAGRICCEGLPTGTQIGVSASVDTLIQNNHIGVAADGVTVIFQTGPYGITLNAATRTTIIDNIVSECMTAGQNHFAGELFGAGITIAGPCADTVIQGNLIGTDATGQTAVTNLEGIRVLPDSTGDIFPTATIIGGLAPGQANTVAFSRNTGITIPVAATGVTISGNSIFDNGLLGIDLGSAGPTPNDPADADTGANNLQNFPVLSSAAITGDSITIRGTLSSRPGRPFRIEYFAGPSCDPSGFGEGRAFLGAFTITTDAAGSAPLVFNGPAPAPGVVTATATDLTTGDTSEFSACLATTDGILLCRADFDGSGSLGVQDIFDYLAAYFTSDLRADFDASGVVTLQDLFDFITAYFTGCP